MIVYLIRHPDQREKMRALGLEQAARFTWEEAALKTLAVYHSLTGSPAGTN
jgi:spore maturation protein CgeB